MDSANHVSNEQGNCPVPVIPGNSVVQNLLNDSSQNLLDDSRFLSVPRFVGHHPMGESPALDGAHGSHEPSCRSCTTDAESFSLGSPSCYGVLEVADDASFEEQILPQASTPPRRESFSHLSLESTNESFVDIQALPNAIRSDLGSNGASGFPINGLDDEPTVG